MERNIKSREEPGMHTGQPAQPAGVTQIQVKQTKFEGPLPAPQILKDYDGVYPGAAKIIIKEFQENSRHIRDTSRRDLEAQVEREKRGQYMAFFILIGILAVVCISLLMGNITFAGASGLAFIGLAVKGFIDSGKLKEKEEK